MIVWTVCRKEDKTSPNCPRWTGPSLNAGIVAELSHLCCLPSVVCLSMECPTCLSMECPTCHSGVSSISRDLPEPPGTTHSPLITRWEVFFFYLHLSLFYFSALITVPCSRNRTFSAPSTTILFLRDVLEEEEDAHFLSCPGKSIFCDSTGGTVQWPQMTKNLWFFMLPSQSHLLNTSPEYHRAGSMGNACYTCSKIRMYNICFCDNLNPYPTLNLKPDHHPCSNSLLLRYYCRSNCRWSKCRITQNQIVFNGLNI